MQEETERIQAAQQGDRDALVRLLRAIEKRLYRTAYYMLGNEADALDATQEALIKIYKNISSYAYKSSFLTWSQRILTNTCLDFHRQRKETVSIDEYPHMIDHGYADNPVQTAVENEWRNEQLRTAIQQLPAHHRSVVILRYLQEMTYNEIAEVSNIPINTVKSYLFRARRQLQRILQDDLKGGVSK